MTQTQSSTEPTAHGGDKGRKRHDVVGVAADIWGMTKGDKDPGSDGTDGGSM